MRLRLILCLWVMSVAWSAFAGDSKSPAEVKPFSLAKWQLSLQKDAAKVLPGRTRAEHEAVVGEHIAQFCKEHSD